MALTDTRLRTLKPEPGKTDRLVADGNGLYIRVRAGEGKISRTWQFRRRETGALTITTLGTYPGLPILEARRKALELATKRSVYSPTVEEAVKQWMRERVEPTHRKPELVRGYVDRAILPAIGSRRVRDIEPSEIADAIRAYRDHAGKSAKAREGGRAAGRGLLVIVKGFFRYAVACGWLRQSPASELTAAMLGAPLSDRTRVLSDDEIRSVMTLDGSQGPVLRFLLGTGLRLGEAFNGHREGQYWIVPCQVSKNQREHRVWLSELALAQLEQQPWAARRSFVQHWVTDNAGGWTCHDLRRTFSTRLNEAPPKGLGVPPHIVEKLLNHTLGGVLAVYNRADYDAERRHALEAWSTWLRGLTVTQPADVVSLRQVSQQAA
jgi:integrase